jgi:hypothetical protein
MEKINLTGVSGWTDKKSCWTMKQSKPPLPVRSGHRKGAGLIVHGFCHQGRKGGGQFIGLLPAHADGKTALWVSVHQQDFFALHRQPDAQIFTGGAFPTPPF